MKKFNLLIILIFISFINTDVFASNIDLESKIKDNKVIVTLYFNSDKKFDAFESRFYFDTDKLQLEKNKDNIYTIDTESGFNTVLAKKVFSMASCTKKKGKYKIATLKFTFKSEFKDNDTAYIIFDDGKYYHNEDDYSFKGDVLEVKKINEEVLVNELSVKELKNDNENIELLINDNYSSDLSNIVQKVDVERSDDTFVDSPKTGYSLIIIPFLLLIYAFVIKTLRTKRKIFNI